MKKKSICIVSPSLKLGGIERQLVVLSEFFVRKGHDVSFISCLKHDKFYTLDPRIKLYEPNFIRTKSLLNRLIFYSSLIFFIRRCVLHIKPDTVMTFGDGLNARVILALFGTKFPVFIADQTSPDYKFKASVLLMKKFLYPFSAGMIAQTKFAADYKKSQFKNKLNIKVIPNVMRQMRRFDVEKEDIVLFVGRFAWEKGPDRLIKAFSDIKDRDDWKLLMAGSGPLLEDMKKLTKELGINDRVQFLGKVKNVDLLYSRASIFVMPSLLEGFPNSLMEAMAAGLPCISFDSFPVHEIMKDGEEGIVVNDGDIDALAKSIEFLMNNPSERKRLGNNAMYIKERLSIKKIGEQYLKFIFKNNESVK